MRRFSRAANRSHERTKLSVFAWPRQSPVEPVFCLMVTDHAALRQSLRRHGRVDLGFVIWVERTSRSAHAAIRAQNEVRARTALFHGKARLDRVSGRRGLRLLHYGPPTPLERIIFRRIGSAKAGKADRAAAGARAVPGAVVAELPRLRGSERPGEAQKNHRVPDYRFAQRTWRFTPDPARGTR